MIRYTELKSDRRQNLKEALPLRKPFTVLIEPSSRCNFRCTQCFQSLGENSFTRGRMDMPLERFRKVIAQLQAWKGPRLKVLKLSLYGEPLLNPAFCEMLRIAKEADIAERIETTTNASLLTAAIAEKLVAYGLDYARVSIYASEQEKHERITGSKLDIRSIHGNLRGLLETRKRLKSEKPFVSAKMLDTFGEGNDRFERLYRDAADELYLDKPHSWIKTGEADFIGNYYQENSGAAAEDLKLHTTGRIACPMAFTTMAVRVDGSVSPCCVDFIGGTNLGNIEERTMQELWESDRWLEFQKMQLENRKQENPSCARCDIYLNDHYTLDNIDGFPVERLRGPGTGPGSAAPALLDQVGKARHADERAFAEIRSSGGPVALFGAGDMARYVAAYLRQNGIEPAYICDNDPARRGTLHSGVPVVGYEEFRSGMSAANYHLVVAVGPERRDGVLAQLAAAGEKNPVWYLRGYEMCGPKLDLPFLRGNIGRFEAAYSSLADDFSRKVFINILKAKLSGDFSLYEAVRSRGLYFDKDLVSLGEHEVFLDVGAYKGDALAEFVSRTAGKYDGMIAFEPDAGAAGVLRERAAREGFPGLEIHNCGAWDGPATLSFDGGREGSSRIREPGGAAAPASAIAVDAIDSVLRGRRVTYIAMDIEGAERKAILGAERTIREWTPKMAVCVYHRREDLFDILLLLGSFVPKYRFYLRHYTNDQTETVLYAL